MAGEVNVGTIETVLTLLDQMSGPLAQAQRSLQQFGQEQTNTQSESKKTEQGLTALGVMFANLASNYIMRATDAIIGFGKAAVQNAAEVKMLGHVAEFMGEKYGMTKDQVHAFVETLSKQGITIKQSNDTLIQFAKSNLDIAKATELARLAQSAARIGNMNSSQALMRLIHGIQTQQTETLRTVGVTISAERATKEYAQTLGKNRDQLTAAERQQAIFNAVLKEGEKISGVYNVTMQDAAGKMQSMTRLIEDAGVKMGMVLQPAYEAAVQILYDFWKAVAAAPELFMAMGAAIVAVGLAIQISWLAPVALALAALNLIVGAFTGSIDPITNFKALIEAVGATVVALMEVIRLATFGFVDFRAAFDDTGKTIYALKLTFNELQQFLAFAREGFLTVAIKAYELEAALTSLAAKVSWGKAKEDLQAHLKSTQDYIIKLSQQRDATEKNITALQKEHQAIIEGTDAKKAAGGVIKTTKDLVEEGTKAWQAAMKATADSVEKERNATEQREAFNRRAIESYKLFKNAAEEAQKAGNAVGMVFPKLPDLKPMKEDMMATADGAWKAEEAIRKQADALVKAGVPAEQIRAKLQATGLSAAQVNSIMAQVTETTKKAAASANTLGSNLKASLSDALKSLPGVIMGAIQGGGNVGKAIGTLFGQNIGAALGESVSKSLGNLAKNIGGTLGKGIGALAGPLGSLVGPLLGGVGAKIGGFISGLFGGKAKQDLKEAKALIDDFVKGHGGLADLEKQAKAAGVSLDALLKAKTANEAKKAIEDINKALDEQKKKQDLLAEANDKLNSAMEKYGITIEQLGPKMRQQKLDEQAADLFQDWQLLIGAGVDINVLIEKMGPNMAAYVDQAVRAGVTIPEAMKPAIQALWEQGKLVHDNGEAFTEAEYQALQYGKTQAEMFDTLIEKITSLINALLGIPDSVNTDVNVNVNERRNVTGGLAGEGATGGGPAGPEGFAGGSGGFRDFGLGTPAVLHGVERVQTREQAVAEQSGVAEAVERAVAAQTQALQKSFRDAVLQLGRR